MTLPEGTRLGPYELLSVIGAGAMGVVYRARDTRLNRDVAIKVLPAAVAHDRERLARFEQEARSVAAINHPNILAVHDIGSAEVAGADGAVGRATYMVTELLDGDTLRVRLQQGPLPVRKSIDVVTQLARGLAAAHERGIVHRDVKPENIVLTRDGHVKILDFGLAKAATNDDQTMAGTDPGMVMGTVGYMAPEQVRGQPADARSDLFALGAVLFELADGRRPFARATPAETMTAILNDDPPDFRLGISPGLERVVHHALEKEPGDRFQTARDFAFALQALSEAPASGAAPAVSGSAARVGPRFRARELAAWALAALLGLSAAALYWWPRTPPASADVRMVFNMALPDNAANMWAPSISPDGTQLAFIVRDGAANAIWIRRLDEIHGRVLKGTGNARWGLFWSQDGKSLGFFAGGQLKTIDLASGRVEQIADASFGCGGSWGADGTILFSPDERSPIFRVNAQGGEAKAVTTLDAARHDQSHRWPHFLADGRHFVFMPWNSGMTIRSIQLGSIDGGPPKMLFDSQSEVLVSGKYLIYVQDRPSKLVAQEMNPDTLELVGRPATVVEDDNVDFDWASGFSTATASARVLAYTTGKFRVSQLTWFSRLGRPLGTVGDADALYDPLISPDGRSLVVEKRDADHGSTDLWTVDLLRGAFSRLTSTPGFESVATWSPDGARLAFATDQLAGPKLLVKNANGTGSETTLVDGRAFATDWSSAGLLYMIDGGPTRLDVGLYDFSRGAASPLLNSTFNEKLARFSPDGKWMAYVSDESNEPQIYVRSYPDGAQKTQISTGGGNQPEWRRDGTELFYLTPDSTLMSARITTTGGRLGASAPQALFATHLDQQRVIRNEYSATSDGEKFLIMAPVGDQNQSPLVGVLNWAGGLSRR